MKFEPLSDANDKPFRKTVFDFGACFFLSSGAIALLTTILVGLFLNFKYTERCVPQFVTGKLEIGANYVYLIGIDSNTRVFLANRNEKYSRRFYDVLAAVPKDSVVEATSCNGKGSDVTLNGVVLNTSITTDSRNIGPTSPDDVKLFLWAVVVCMYLLAFSPLLAVYFERRFPDLVDRFMS